MDTPWREYNGGLLNYILCPLMGEGTLTGWTTPQNHVRKDSNKVNLMDL